MRRSEIKWEILKLSWKSSSDNKLMIMKVKAYSSLDQVTQNNQE